MTSPIIILDDDEYVRESMRLFFEGARFAVSAFSSVDQLVAQKPSGRVARRNRSRHARSIAIVDLSLGKSFPDLYQRLVSSGRVGRLIVFTGSEKLVIEPEAFPAVAAVIRKPFSLAGLRDVVVSLQSPRPVAFFSHFEKAKTRASA